MKVEWLSKSAIDAFRQCPKRYEFELVRRADKAFQPIEWEIGTRVHNVINRLMKHYLEHPTFKGIIGSTKNEEWFLKSYDEETRELKRRVQTGQVRIVRPEKTLEDYVQFGAECLKNFTCGVLPRLANQKILQTEGGFPPNFIIAAVKIVGKFDLVVEDKGGIHVHDWKTGKARKNDDFQGKLYYFAARHKYRSAHISDFTFYLHYLAASADEMTQSFDFAEDSFTELVAEIAEIKGAVEATREFLPKTSKLCHWCPYNPLCSEGRAFIADNPLDLDESEELV